jgi:hypothetical protein
MTCPTGMVANSVAIPALNQIPSGLSQRDR